MRLAVPATQFPAIKVPVDQAMQFAATCDRIVDSTLVARQEYVHRYHRSLNPAKWELVKRRVDSATDLAVYKPHRASRTPRPATTVTSSPILIGVGSVQGSLDDIMLGLTATTTSTQRSVTSTLYSNVADSRVLNRMDTPNEADPFGFLGVKWLLKTPSVQLTPLARARDFIYLESTGIRYLEDESDGARRVGFQLLHSVDLSCYPPLPFEFGAVRGHMSFCFLFEENADGKSTDVFCKGFVDPRGGLAQCLTIATAADIILDCSKAMASANRKKLDWRMRHQVEHIEASATCTASATQLMADRDTYVTLRDDSILLSLDACVECHTRRRRGTVPSMDPSCSVCGDRVCSRCSHQLRREGTSSSRPVCCTHCVERARSLDSASIAREDTLRAMALLPPGRASGTSPCVFSRDKMRLAPLHKRRHTLDVAA